jgi:hypothetical protein
MEMVYALPAPVELPIEVIDMPLVMGVPQRQVAIWNGVCLWIFRPVLSSSGS